MLDFIKTFINPGPEQGVQLYPYDFSTSGFARVDEVRFLIEDQSEWDYTYDTAHQEPQNLKAAARFGYGPTFTGEEIALCRVLAKLNAGAHIMTYAWGLYDDLIKSEMKCH